MTFSLADVQVVSSNTPVELVKVQLQINLLGTAPLLLPTTAAAAAVEMVGIPHDLDRAIPVWRLLRRL